MVGISDRHAAVLDELVEWWQDLSRQEINSRAVLLPVPPGLGPDHLLNEFAAVVEDDEAISIVVRVPGAALRRRAWLAGARAAETVQLKPASSIELTELLGVDRLGGATQFGLSVAGLFVSPLATLVGLLLAGIGVSAAGKVWDDSLAGQEGISRQAGPGGRGRVSVRARGRDHRRR